MTFPAGASKTELRDIQPTNQGLPSRPTDVVRMIGITPWGPMGVATICTDFDEWQKTFGPHLASYFSSVMAQQMFLAGVRELITVRTAHYGAGSAVPLTAAKSNKTFQTGAGGATKASVTGSLVGPWALTSGDTLKGKVGGVAAPERTVTLTATAAVRENAPAETYALVNGQTLTVKVDRESVAQSIAFLTAEFVNIALATAEEVAAVINAKIVGAHATVTSGGTKVTITSDKKGYASYVEVTGGTANAVLLFNVAEVQGTGNDGAGHNFDDIASVTYSELKAMIEASWTDNGGVTVTSSSGYLKIETNSAGAAAKVQVLAASTADDEIGLDNAEHVGSDGAAVDTLKVYGKYEGTLGDLVTIVIADASDGNAEHFNLSVYQNGTLERTWVNLTMDSSDSEYAETVINGVSGWITVEDKDAAGTTLQRRPANASATALTGGNDGLTALADVDFYGVEGNGTGLFAFDLLPDDGDLLISPDCTTEGFQDEATETCRDHWKGKCIFVPDIPAGCTHLTAAAHADLVTASDARLPHLWPRVSIPNPDKDVYGTADIVTVPTSGLYVGRMAANTRTNAETTAEWTQPGNQIYGLLENAVGLESDTVLKPNVREYLAAHLINPIIKGRTEAGNFGVWVNDVMPGTKASLWNSVGNIRGVAHLRKVLEAYFETQRTQPNTMDARYMDKYRIESHLAGLCSRGCFATRSAPDAFYVNTDPEGTGINNPAEQRAQRYHSVVGLAIAEPKRFIDIGLTRDDRAVESWIQKQMAM